MTTVYSLSLSPSLSTTMDVADDVADDGPAAGDTGSPTRERQTNRKCVGRRHTTPYACRALHCSSRLSPQTTWYPPPTTRTLVFQRAGALFALPALPALLALAAARQPLSVSAPTRCLSDASRLRGGSFCAGEDRRGDVDGGECGLPVIYAYRAARGAAEEADSLHFPGASLNQLSAAFAVQQTRETAVGSAPRWTMATKSGVAKRSQNLSDHLA